MSDEPAAVTAPLALPTGARLVIRRAELSDVALLDALFRGLNADDRYRRFFSAFQPSAGFLEKLATANDRGAVALIAIVERNDGIRTAIGEASAWPLADGNGELGLTVAERWRGWIGPYLLDALLAAAATAGFANLEADVLLANAPMLALLRARGCAAVAHDGYHTVRLAISTCGPAPSWPPAEHQLRVLIESPSARWEDLDLGLPPDALVAACGGPASRSSTRPCPALRGEPCPLAADADAIVVRGIVGAQCEVLLRAHAAVHPTVPVHRDIYGGSRHHEGDPARSSDDHEG